MRRTLVVATAALVGVASCIQSGAGPATADGGASQWRETTLGMSRARPTASALADGRVLVAGGRTIGADGSPAATATAEVFDAAAQRWTPVSPMATPRVGHSAVTLPDGRVLVAGGFSQSAAGAVSTATAELFDPVTQTWGATGSLLHARMNFAMTLLTDGRVLVAGGATDVPGVSARLFPPVIGTAEIYDPGTGQWSAAAPMLVPRDFFTLTTLRDGRVLAAGGDGYPAHTAASEIFDPATGLWTPTASLDGPRAFHEATLLPDGRVLVVGGSPQPSLTSAIAAVEVYDPATATWSAAGTLTDARWGPAVVVTGATVVVAGGIGFRNAVNSHLRSVELLDLATMHWGAGPFMATARGGHGFAPIAGGLVVVGGGRPPVASAEHLVIS